MQPWVWLILSFWVSSTGTVMASEDLSWPHISDDDIISVKLQISEALGDSIFDALVIFIESVNFEKSDLGGPSYVEFGFLPPDQPLEVVPLKFLYFEPGVFILVDFLKNPISDLSRISKHPSLFKVNISREEAIKIALECNLKGNISEYETNLVLVNHRDSFYWLVSGKVKSGNGGRVTTQEYLLINANTGLADEVMGLVSHY